MFEGRVGAKPPPERIVAIHKEGEERYAKKIPPGLEDTKKAAEGGDKFGDLVIWKEIIEKAKADKRPVRSGPAKLNSAISGSSGYKAGPRKVLGSLAAKTETRNR